MARTLTLAEITRVVERASLAPSIHNSQPWRFEWTGSALDVHLDATRHLPAIDPQGRQQHLSVGAAIEFAALAMRFEGFLADVELLPGPPESTHVARVTPGREVAVDSATRQMVLAMPRRATYRGGFDPRPIPPGVLNHLCATPLPAGSWVSIVPSERLVELAAALDRAEANLLLDEAYRDELAAWLRDDEDCVDGLPPAVLRGSTDAVSALPIRRFDLAGAPERPESPPRVDAPTVVVIGCDVDDRTGWLDTGRAMARLLLAATGLGLSSSPLTQSLDHVLDRQRTRHHLGLLSHPQMILRLGYGQPVAVSPRRPVDEVLTVRG